MKRSGFTAASKGQKAKVITAGYCVVCGLGAGEEGSRYVLDPAHVVARAMGGCEDPECAAPLCRRCHRAYDNGELDLLPYLTLEEQAHAVSHLGILGALKRTTGERYVPELKASDFPVAS